MPRKALSKTGRTVTSRRGRGKTTKPYDGPGRKDVMDRNSDAIDFSLEMMSWPSIDLSDADAMRQRFNDYLELCRKYNTKPLISGMCAVMGFTRNELTSWAKGNNNNLARRLSPESAELLARLSQMNEIYWEFAMQNNEYRNPVTGIFLGKNNFGYKDVSETIVRHDDEDAAPDRKALERKYRAAIPLDDVKVEEVHELGEGGMAGNGQEG